ncbi:hypothetical protein [Serratia microhaemolytica]|uniref:hypothetical protein n=1 Tax=Serratia microhaemolytica TaxID=2675110 RepID=UPI000FDD5406|nr:hypothetical protein [Serratia microhaemolytica]
MKDNAPPTWFSPWLYRPGWQILATQWLLLAGLALLLFMLFGINPWRHYQTLQQQRQQAEAMITQRQQQLALLPELALLTANLQQQRSEQQTAQRDLASQLYQLGGQLLHWQQQEQVAQQSVVMQLEFNRLLALLAEMPANSRIEQLKITQRPEGLVTQLRLQHQQKVNDE